MTLPVFHPAAEAELLEQALYYEQRSLGLELQPESAQKLAVAARNLSMA